MCIVAKSENCSTGSSFGPKYEHQKRVKYDIFKLATKQHKCLLNWFYAREYVHYTVYISQTCWKTPMVIILAPVLVAPVLKAPVLKAPVLEAPMLVAPVLEAPVLTALVLAAPLLAAPVLEAPQC